MKLFLRATLSTLLAVVTATASVLLGAPAWVTVGLVILITGLQQWLSANGLTQSALEREASSEKFERVFHASPNWIVITRLADGVVIDANEQFVAAFRLTPDFMSISSAQDGRYVEVNQAFERFTGRKREDVIGRTSTEIGLWHDTAERADMMQRIEALVQERTAQLQAANDELSQALKTIELARDSLVQSEKLASLGALVAGIAHELNTPIGNGLMVASTLDEKAQEFAIAAKQPMQRSALDRFVSETQNAAELLVRSLGRSAALVSSFKQVAVDQTSSHRRIFDLRGLVDEAVLTISPATQRAHCTVLLNIEPQLTFDSHPGPLVQVLTNLINNALVACWAGALTCTPCWARVPPLKWSYPY